MQFEPQPIPDAVAPPAPMPAPAPAKLADRESLGAALRELEAAKGRVERDARAACDDMRKKLVVDLLPVLDNLDRTIEAARQNGDAPAVVDGIYLVRAQLEAVLRGYGVERIDAADEPFDPQLHDAITTVRTTPDRHKRVVQQLACGYRFGGALLRPAQVVVGTY